MVSDAHYLSCFTDAKTTTRWKKSTLGFLIMLFYLFLKIFSYQNLYCIYKLLFLHLDSSEEIREKILRFLDIIITKMRTPEEDIIPLESCQCEEILELVIMPLAHHFLALGENNKALYYFLEISSAYLILGDNYMVSCFCRSLPPLRQLTDRRTRREALVFSFVFVLFFFGFIYLFIFNFLLLK